MQIGRSHLWQWETVRQWAWPNSSTKSSPAIFDNLLYAISRTFRAWAPIIRQSRDSWYTYYVRGDSLISRVNGPPGRRRLLSEKEHRGFNKFLVVKSRLKGLATPGGLPGTKKLRRKYVSWSKNLQIIESLGEPFIKWKAHLMLIKGLRTYEKFSSPS